MEFMSEEPKSIWKKSWTGWGRLWLWAWLVLVLPTLLIGLVISLFIPGRPRAFTDWEAALNISIGVAIIGGICVGLLAFGHWIFRWRNFRRFLFGLASLATLIALFYAEEDWRGWHAWNQFKHEWEAKGEKFDFASVVPPSMPDDQNFAFSPVWIAEVRYNFQSTPKRAEAWYGTLIYSDAVSKLMPLMPVTESGLVGTNWAYRQPPTPEETSGNWAKARLPDLKPWQAYYRGFEKTNPAAEIPITPQPQSPAADVSLALSKFDPVIEQLRQDSTRPDSRFPIQYDTDDPAAILIPHLAAVKRCALVLRLRAVAELQDGQTDKALADVKLLLRLVNSVRAEPFLISHLVRIADLEIAAQPIYVGLAEHEWSDAQLVELDAELEKLNFVADYQLAMRGEMGMQNGIFELLRRHPEQLPSMSSANGGGNASPPLLAKALYRLIPSGWFYQNQLHCARPMVELILPVADASQQTVSPTKVQKADAEIGAQTRHRSIFNIFARLLLPSLGNASKRFAYGQASIDLARTAIALERYRLAQGGYPDSLDALAPQFMKKVPHDVIGGPPSQSSGATSQPLHYRRTDDGQFVLYSIGWNERDDGGVVVFSKGSTKAMDIDQGDWVWRYPQK
jgi:hypothetical protein